jgi:V8-like Glu-specific endopeptidase
MNVVWLNKTLWPWVGFVRSFFPRMAGSYTVGSGSLIDPHLILTAGHVVFDPSRGGYPNAVDVAIGGQQRKVVPSSVFRTTVQWKETDSLTLNPVSAYDVGAILLADPIDPGLATPIQPPAGPAPDLSSTSLNVVGFPADSDKIGQLYGAQSFPTPTTLDAFRIFYPITTLGGMSGGPVYEVDSAGQIIIRGVHTSYNSDDGLGSALRMTDGIVSVINTWLREVRGS